MAITRTGEEAELFERVSAEEGWDASTQVGLLMEFIGNQGSAEAFADFVEEQRDSEDWSCPRCDETLQDGSGVCITCGHDSNDEDGEPDPKTFDLYASRDGDTVRDTIRARDEEDAQRQAVSIVCKELRLEEGDYEDWDELVADLDGSILEEKQ